MANTTNGIGAFTADNIVAVLTVIPETNGTYDEIIQAAKKFGATVTSTTVARWVTKGKSDIKEQKQHTAYARFARQFAELLNKHCGPDHNRNRELDRALRILEQSCECGEDRHVYSDGSVAQQCRRCLEMQQQKSRRSRPAACPRCGGNLRKTQDGLFCLQCARPPSAEAQAEAA